MYSENIAYMNITFLGTTAMVPTKDRNHTGIFIDIRNHGILVDCGENIQRQLLVAGIKLTKEEFAEFI